MATNSDSAGKENDIPPSALTKRKGRKQAAAKEPTRCKWNAANDAILITKLRRQKVDGNESDNAGWKAEVWTACALVLAGSEKVSGGIPKSANACLTRWGSLKAQYAIVKELRGKSGWGWDDVAMHVVVDNDIWEAYLKVKPKIKEWRYKGFPLYDDMAILVDGAVATGEGAFQPGQSAKDIDAPPLPQTPAPHQVLAPRAPRAPSPDWDIQPGDFDTPSQPRNEEESSASSSQASSSADIIPESTELNRTGKRTRASSDSPSSDKPKRVRTDGHGRKPSNGHAIMEMSNSLKDIAGALRIDFAGPSSPKRKTDAIKSIMKLVDFTQLEKIQIIQLVRSDTSIADTYLALGEDEDLQVAYLRVELQPSS